LPRIIFESNELAEIIDDIPKFPFPLMNYLPDASELAGVLNSFKEKEERIVEAGRLTLAESFRSFKMVRHIIESALAVYFYKYKFEHAIWVCNSSNAGIYRRLYGLKNCTYANNGQIFYNKQLGNILIGAPLLIPSKSLNRILKMAKAYKQTGSITYNPSNPNCFDIPENTTGQPVNLIPAVA
jgi:hypothetical protein